MGWAVLQIDLPRDEYKDSRASLVEFLEPVSGDLVRGSGPRGCETYPLLFQNPFWIDRNQRQAWNGNSPRAERAVELYALASRYPFVVNSRWFEDVAGKHIAATVETLPPEVVAAARERGRTRDDAETIILAQMVGQFCVGWRKGRYS